MADKVILTCAVTGTVTMPVQTQYLPITQKQIADDAIRAANAGASNVHIHARDPKIGRSVSDINVFREIVTDIKARSNVVVGITTSSGPTIKDRMRVVTDLEPELASFNMGTINFAVHPIADRYKDSDYRFDWEKEYILNSKEGIFRNSFGDLEYGCQMMKEHNTKPEYEAYDVGHLYNMALLIRQGFIKPPMWIQFVTGVLGGIGNRIEDVMYMRAAADRLFGAQNYQWSVIGAGFPGEFYCGTLAVMLGGHVRVGLEDNIFVNKGVLAKSNAELVEKMVRIIRELGREPATPDEARQMLGLKGKDKVKY
jgi:uncharacterized protein (DUF849 family)